MSSPSLSVSSVIPKYLEIGGPAPYLIHYPADMRVLQVAFKIQMEEVLPGFIHDRPGFDLQEIQTLLRKEAEDVAQRSCLVLDRKHHAYLVRAFIKLQVLAYDYEARIVFAVEVQVFLKYIESIDGGGSFTCDSCPGNVSSLAYKFCAKSGVVIGNELP